MQKLESRSQSLESKGSEILSRDGGYIKGFCQENCGTLEVGVVFFLLFLFFLKLLNLVFPLKKIFKRNKPEILPLVKF